MRCWRVRRMWAWSGTISRRQADAEQVRESFNRRMRDELLDEPPFFTVRQAHLILASWVNEYNTERPHSSLGYGITAEFTAELEKQRVGLNLDVPPVF